MNITDLLSRLLVIEQALEELSCQCADLYISYDGTDFLEQNALATKTLDNLILAATHETASTLCFLRQDLAVLTQFMALRKQFSQFNHEELARIIDQPMLSAKEMLQLKAKCATIIDKKSEIKMAWKVAFGQLSYGLIASKFIHP